MLQFIIDHELSEKYLQQMSRQVHDEVGGYIASTLNALELFEYYRDDRDQTRAKAKISDARRALHHALHNAKEVAVSLRTATQWRRNEVKQMRRVGGQPLQARESPMRPTDHEEIFAILREAVRNAVNHASANSITVRLSASDDDLTVSVEDDGVGIPSLAGESPISPGLKSMRERVNFLGGTFRLLSGGESGTRIAITVPLHRM